MKDSTLWGMFCETGDPLCYLMYRSALKEKEKRPRVPPGVGFAADDTGTQPRVRF